ncbi:MAG: universal stress protein [Planctomycetaceae bacterium]
MTTVEQNYERILVATDFSPHAEAALKQAIWLARLTKAKITLAHTLPDLRKVVHQASTLAKLDLLQGEGNQFDKEVKQKSEAKLRQIVCDLNAGDVQIDYQTLLGEAYVELTHYVQGGNFDLVLAGTRGKAAWEQFFVGSTAKRLIRKCPADVWIVKAEHVGPPQVVLAATDFSDVSFQAVMRGFQIAQQANAVFHLLHVIDSNDVPEDLIEHIPAGSTLRQEIDKEAQKRLQSFLDTLPADRSRIETHMSYGTPWMEVGRTAQHLHADLIVMGTIGRGGIKGLLLGNTAEKVLDTCDCSILTIKPEGFESPI